MKENVDLRGVNTTERKIKGTFLQVLTEEI